MHQNTCEKLEEIFVKIVDKLYTRLIVKYKSNLFRELAKNHWFMTKKKKEKRKKIISRVYLND